MQQIVLAKGRDRSVRQRHPWIFSGAVAHGTAALGETVAVLSAGGECLGYGSFSPQSQIRVRMLSFDPKHVPDASFITDLVQKAIVRRAAFFADASSTNACRLIHAESDGLPGVVADFYDGFIVCQLTSAGAEYWQTALVAALMTHCPRVQGVAVRKDAEVRLKEGLTCSPELEVLAGEAPPELIAITEGAIRYFVDPRKGHKTGFYLDQRDARALVGSLAADKEVLNCFSYTGGFGLAAARAGAKSVTQVDISAEAIELARKNVELNAGSPRIVPMLAMTNSDEHRHCEARSNEAIHFVEADVFKYLRTCRDAGKQFDLIVLDPPKFADTKVHLMKAARGYKDINLLAMKLLRPGGILATFSCSGAMTQDLFDQVLREAALDAHRDFQVIARTRQGLDHPVALSFPEGFYLKGVILRG